MTTPDKEEMPTDIRTAGDFWAEKRDGRWQLQMRHRGPGSSFCVAQINHWADNPEALTTRIADACNAYEPMRKALEKVMVGGNHLGLIIGADHPPHTANHEEARAHYGDAIWTYEVWCCWKTIMEARPALSTLPVIDRQTSDDVGRLREALEATTAEIERDLNDHLSSVCVVRDDVPDRSTMEPEDAEEAARIEGVISRARAALKAVPQPATQKEIAMTEAQIKHMVDRFLMWKLPEHFNPDGGISFEPVGNKDTQYEYRHDPVGTNLLSAEQATAMVRHMLEGLPQHASEAGKLSTDEVL